MYRWMSVAFASRHWANGAGRGGQVLSERKKERRVQDAGCRVG